MPIASFLSFPQISAQKWNEFIENSPQGGVFALYEYASIVAENWQVVLVEEGDKWLAVMPLCLKKKYFLSYTLQPIFTQYWGIFFANELFKTQYEKYSFYQKILRLILEKIPSTYLFVHHFSPKFDYALPFHWEKYELKTRYTYQIDLQEIDIQEIWKNMANPLQRQIKKAIKNQLQVEETNNSAMLFHFLANQPKNVLGVEKKHETTFQQLTEYLLSSGHGKLFQIKNREGEIRAIALFSYFNKQVVYHLGLISPNNEDNSVMDFLLWKAIEWAKEKEAEVFDFEGSMIENIERFFRKFGAKPVPYLQITKRNWRFFLDSSK
ncbi:MAG: GNAT family N-acetyltransferase [Bacteroidia bacterium]